MARFKLVLGTPVSTTVRPWIYLDIPAVMVSSYDLLMNVGLSRARGRGLRRLLGIDDGTELWLDSGGYQFLSKGVDIPVEKLARLYREVDADFYLSLDYPPGPKDSPKLRAYKIARSVTAFGRLKTLIRDIVEEGRLVPVFHISTGESLRLQLRAYESCAVTAAVGGLIPYIMQQAGRGSRLKAVMFMALMRKLWRGKLHALGLASAAMIPLLKAIGLDSGDTQTWRRKAAYGKIIIPGLGERHVSEQRVRFGPAVIRSEDEMKLFMEYLGKARSLGLSGAMLRDSFEHRALFNAWILLEVASNGHGYAGASKAFANLYSSIEELKKMNPEEIEASLEALLRAQASGTGGASTPRIRGTLPRMPTQQTGLAAEGVGA